jgi:hypothetical protein
VAFDDAENVRLLQNQSVFAFDDNFHPPPLGEQHAISRLDAEWTHRAAVVGYAGPDCEYQRLDGFFLGCIWNDDARRCLFDASTRLARTRSSSGRK